MKYFLSIGSNIEATKNIDFAIYELGLILSNIEISSYYKNRAVGFEGDDFINLVIAGDSSLGFEELVAASGGDKPSIKITNVA